MKKMRKMNMRQVTRVLLLWGWVTFVPVLSIPVLFIPVTEVLSAVLPGFLSRVPPAGDVMLPARMISRQYAVAQPTTQVASLIPVAPPLSSVPFLTSSSALWAVNASGFKQSKHIDLIDFLTGRFNPAEANEYTRIGRPYANRPMYLRKDVFAAFKKMKAAAEKDNVSLYIVSAFRGYNDQERIWKRKYKAASLSESEASNRVALLMEYSSPPGFSRHHWGCDIDLNSVSSGYFNTKQGQAVAAWLSKNAKNFGFYLTYTDGRTKGFKSEPWQYSYYPVCSDMMYFFQVYVLAENVNQFAGADSVNVDGLLKEYISSINPEILQRMQIDGKFVY